MLKKVLGWTCGIVIGLGCSVNAVVCQEAASDSLVREKAVKVFLDVPEFYQDHIKREIPFLNYVRDPKEAQLYILYTSQETGSGGTEHMLFFIGQQNLAGQNDTLTYVSYQHDTEEIIRAGLVKVLKAGVLRHVAKTPLFDKVTIGFKEDRSLRPTAVVDPWKNWVFGLSANGFFNGEESRNSLSVSGSFTADKVTPELKLSFSLSTDYDENNFTFDDYKISSFSRSHSFRFLGVKSLTDHWSVGAFQSLRSSLYSNIKFSASVAPAIEYNVFPYSQSTRREFRFLYRLEFEDVQYEEETLFDKLKERLFSESLSATLELKEKWGSVSTTLSGSHYFHDFSKNNLGLSGSVNVRLFEGFSVNLFGSVSMIHDQLSLPKRGATQEEVLLHRKQLATQYDYFVSVGIRYTFGSIYSNVVNPRFGSAGGRRVIIIG